jgi:hypothetical protein
VQRLAVLLAHLTQPCQPSLRHLKYVYIHLSERTWRYDEEGIMASEQSDHLAEVLGAAQDRLRNRDLGLPTSGTFATLWAR